MSIIVDLALATICFTYNGAEECHPILYGKDTPLGNFTLTHMLTNQPGYGGDILKFDESSRYIFAIHRVYTLNAQQRRLARLKSKSTSDNVISAGCINVENEVYNKLIDCCRMENLTILR